MTLARLFIIFSTIWSSWIVQFPVGAFQKSDNFGACLLFQRDITFYNAIQLLGIFIALVQTDTTNDHSSSASFVAVLLVCSPRKQVVVGSFQDLSFILHQIELLFGACITAEDTSCKAKLSRMLVYCFGYDSGTCIIMESTRSLLVVEVFWLLSLHQK